MNQDCRVKSKMMQSELKVIILYRNSKYKAFPCRQIHVYLDYTIGVKATEVWQLGGNSVWVAADTVSRNMCVGLAAPYRMH